jgi:glycosyltransferase involved in cell wall biosynthesis
MSVSEDINNVVWLSVIVPTYNGELKIGDALISVRRQNNDGVEVIVVDDGSTDSTLEVVKSYRNSLNIKIIEREHNGNWVSNTNRGILNSSGKYICFLHQDDRWEDGRLKIICGILESNPNVAMCFHPARFIGPDDRYIGSWGCPFSSGNPVNIISPDIFFQSLLLQNFICVSAPVFKKEIAVKVGLLDDSLIYTADWDFWLKLSRTGPIAYIAKPMTCFRIHPGSQTEKISNNANDAERQLVYVLKRHLPLYEGKAGIKKSICKTAAFSIQINVALMRISSGQSIRWRGLLWGFLGLGIIGWNRFFRCSRIIDRVSARLKARLRYRDIW